VTFQRQSCQVGANHHLRGKPFEFGLADQGACSILDRREDCGYDVPRLLRYPDTVRSVAKVEALHTTLLLVVLAFCLGACPFSVWIGQWVLGKDIRDFGDGNPGAANVFRAGGRVSGCMAVILDVAKGVPFVALAHLLFGLSEIEVMAVALSAILGHAFSPILRLRGGKSVAVTFGVLLALPQHEMLVTFTAFMLLGFLFLGIDAWAVILAPIGSLAYLLATLGSSWESLFMLCVIITFAIKHFRELQTSPIRKGRLINWLQSRRREA